MSQTANVEIKDVSHRYGERLALNKVSFSVFESEIFGLLGPNGGGKTTLFRILSTLFPVTEGDVKILGKNLKVEQTEVRKAFGVVFQAPSLDKKLTVAENLRHQGHLYGLSGEALNQRMSEMLKRVALTDRQDEIVEKLSGGLQRRAELAKAFLHRPRLLLLDEPSTGLDPGARKDLWDYLAELKRVEGTTILVTTHLMEEAEKCDRLGILNHGELIALDTPDQLRRKIGGEVITIKTSQPEQLSKGLKEKFGGEPKVIDQTVRLERNNGHELITRIVETFPGQIESITIGKPTLEDVFIQLTGHRFWNQTE